MARRKTERYVLIDAQKEYKLELHVAFSATIAISVYITKEPMCLLAFILLPIVYAQMGN